jgi:hypothetical protein
MLPTNKLTKKLDDKTSRKIVKQGQLMRISGKGTSTKITKKAFWFVLFEDGTLEYYIDPASVVTIFKIQISKITINRKYDNHLILIFHLFLIAIP